MKNNALNHLFKNIKFYPLELSISVVSGISATLAALFISKLIGDAVDFALYPGQVDFECIFVKLAIIALITVLGAILRFLSSLYSGSLSYKIENILRINLFKNLNFTPLSYIDSTPHGDIVSRITNDTEAVGEGLYQFLTQVFPGIATVIGAIILMAKTNYQVMWLVIILTPFLFITSWLITKFSYKNFRNYANIQGELMSFSEEMISNQFVVNAFGYQKCSIEKFQKINSNLYKSGVKSQFFSSLANPTIRLVSWIIYASVGTFGAYILLTTNSLTIGNISSLLIYVAQYTRPFTDIMGIITQIQSAFAALNRYSECIDAIIDKKEPSGTVILDKCDGKININNLSFAYIPENPIIKNFNLEINPGSKVALVGPTGCGKSTIINLLMRFYDPEFGYIEIDNIPIENIELKSLRNHYGMILQDTWLYTASVKDNIAYGKPDATLDEIIHAAKLANAHEFIKKLENGYETVLSENGSNISQGQKQLLSIARIMLVNPKILILDEATSSIDTRTEIKIQNAFNKLMQGKTSIIVAHRLSTIEKADIIVVINNGQIVEKGTHNELISNKKFYYNLYKSQF